MGQITATRNLVATKVVRLAGQQQARSPEMCANLRVWRNNDVRTNERTRPFHFHYCDVIMSAMTSQITSLTTVYSTVYSGADQRTHQCSASLAFVRGIHRLPVNSPHKWPVTRKMFPFDDVMMLRVWRNNDGLMKGRGLSILVSVLMASYFNNGGQCNAAPFMFMNTLFCNWIFLCETI